ncbi:MAG: hypothetical protein K0S07_1275 [Chlamydiales bacterium]|jgi:hypothetical protein|nr:hypothetical protein [Chlamydiales bacterium]
MNSIEGVGGTRRDYLDQTRPKQVIEGEKLFNQLLSKKGRVSTQALALASTINRVIQEDSDLSTLEERLQGIFGEEFQLSGETDFQKLETALGFFYAAINFVDQKSKNTLDVKSFQVDYSEAKRFVERQIAPNYTLEEQRQFAKISKLIDNRVKSVSNHFNEKREKGTVAGPKIQ